MRFLISIACVSVVAGQGAADDFEVQTYTSRSDGAKMPYRLLKPNGYDKAKKYPLVLFLHGWNERGTDNANQLKLIGPLFLKSATRKKYPSFVLAPQANASWIQNPEFDKPVPLSPKPTTHLRLAVEIVDALKKKEAVDADRLYLMGYSNGACGAWELLERNPKSWAAAVPMAGAGDPRRVAAAKEVPIWAFHGDKDTTIPLARMQELIMALESAQGSAMYTIIPKGGHYDAKSKGLAEKNLLPWMFAQRRGQPAVAFDTIAGPSDKRPTSLAK